MSKQEQLDRRYIGSHYFGEGQDNGVRRERYDYQILQAIEGYLTTEKTIARLTGEYFSPEDPFLKALERHVRLAKQTIIVGGYFLNGGNRIDDGYLVSQGIEHIASFANENWGDKLLAEAGISAGQLSNFMEVRDKLTFITRYTKEDGTWYTVVDCIKDDDKKDSSKRDTIRKIVQVDLIELGKTLVSEFGLVTSWSLKQHLPFSEEGGEPTLFELFAKTVLLPKQTQRLKEEEQKMFEKPENRIQHITAALGGEWDFLAILYNTIAIKITGK